MSRTPYYRRYGVVGQGVDIAGITRARVTGLDAQVRISASTQGRLDDSRRSPRRHRSSDGRTECRYHDRAINGLWTALDELALDPPNASTRQGMISSLNNLATTIGGVADKWKIEETSASGSLSVYVDKTNAMLRRSQISTVRSSMPERCPGNQMTYSINGIC